MPTYTQKAYTERTVKYERSFLWVDMPSGGFGFECDENGRVDIMSMAEAGRENYLKCVMGVYKVIDDGIQRYEVTHRHRSYIACETSGCNGEIGLYNFTNTCYECGADYNMSGSRLAPRSQWGEETGEHWTECY